MRRPNIRSAGADFAFLVVALIAGLAGATWLVAGMVYAAAIAVWWWMRRGALSRLAPRPRMTQSAIAVLMLAAAMGIFYWFGLMLGGHT